MVPHRIDLGAIHPDWEGQWADIKPWMSYANSAFIASKRADVPMMGTLESFQGRGEVRVDVTTTAAEYACAMVTRQVLNWHILGYDGEPLPAGRAGVLSDATPVEVMDVLIDEMNTYYESLKPNFNRGQSA